jgi:hypothetical protein
VLRAGRRNRKVLRDPDHPAVRQDDRAITHARASALRAKWTWPAWEETGEAVAFDGAHAYSGIIVTFTTGSSTKVVVLVSSQTCPGCAY